MPREIENPKSGVHLEPSKGARAQGKWSSVLHGAKLPVDDDPAKSFRGPNELFEARAANPIVDHFRTKSLGAFEDGLLDIFAAGDEHLIGSDGEQRFLLGLRARHGDAFGTDRFSQLKGGNAHRRTGRGYDHVLI